MAWFDEAFVGLVRNLERAGKAGRVIRAPHCLVPCVLLCFVPRVRPVLRPTHRSRLLGVSNLTEPHVCLDVIISGQRTGFFIRSWISCLYGTSAGFRNVLV